MSLAAVFALAFFLGMRHATDPDHVVAVSTIVAREKTLRAAAPVGGLWGLGHTLTILLVGGAVILFGVVIPPRVGQGLEVGVGVMLVVLGALNVVSAAREGSEPKGHSHAHAARERRKEPTRVRALRPLLVGVVHGLAGSAAVALLVLGTIQNALWGVVYLLVFGAGTIVGMLLISLAIAMPVVVASQRFARFHQTLAAGTGVASIVFGAALVYELGIARGFFAGFAQ